MSLPKFEYMAAPSIEEASKLAEKLGPKCRLMAGGTDVIALMKDRVDKPDFILDLKNIPGMNQLEYIPGEGFKIGALTKLRAIETSPLVKEKLGALADAAHYVASTQIRNKGTMAGNICNASPSADTASILIVLNATVKTFRNAPKGGRLIPIGEFFKGVKRTTLEQGEIVTEIDIPELKPGEGAAYFKHAVRKAMDLAIVGVAAWIKMEGNKCIDCRIALGGVATTPIRAQKAEAVLIGQELSVALIENASEIASGPAVEFCEFIVDAADAAAEGCKPISDVRASAEYRQDMIRVFTKRALKKALENLKK